MKRAVLVMSHSNSHQMPLVWFFRRVKKKGMELKKHFLNDKLFDWIKHVNVCDFSD